MNNSSPLAIKRTIISVLRTPFGIFLAHAAMFGLAALLAFWLRFDFSIPTRRWEDLLFALPVWMTVKLGCLRLFGLDRNSWRHVSVPDALRAFWASIAACFASTVFIVAFGPRGFPRSIYLLDFIISYLFWASSLFCIRSLLEKSSSQKPLQERPNAVIYGAGSAGVALLREMRGNSRAGFEIRGFIDDDSRKRGAFIHGTKILGSGRDLKAVVQSKHVNEVLIAIPSASGQQMLSILEKCELAGVRCRTIPSLTEMIQGKELARQIRDVSVDDLLGRVEINLDELQIRESISGHTVLVTGAAGSIGSELCRQIAKYSPTRIVGLDIAETGMFHLESEMQERFPAVTFCSEIGSIQNRGRIADLLIRHHPRAIFHAAAYKHVPILEKHLLEAIENNILGTANIALLAAEYGVQRFVMISTDKAVHPTSVLGATKRFAELLIDSLESKTTRYVSVRFGNVLGSNGSVIPLFKKQIAAGGPVTVTHQDMRRYFMTIPEAAQLVLQAATMSEGGEIFILDMGQPVRILDLAHRLIRLSGFVPDVDIKVEITGVRPGEKLYEELSGKDESTLRTPHPKVQVYSGPAFSAQTMLDAIDRLVVTVNRRDQVGAMRELMRIVGDYQPSGQVGTPVSAPTEAVSNNTPLLTKVARFSSAGSLIALLMLSFVAQPILGTDFYVTPTGNDANSGTTQATAWATISRINRAHLEPGDRVLLARGGFWRETLVVPGSGSEGRPITICAYGPGAKPVLSGADFLTNWSDFGDGLWHTQVSSAPTQILRNYERLTRVSSIERLANDNFWFYDKTSSSLIVRSATKPLNLEVSARDYAFRVVNRSHVVLEEVILESAKNANLSEYSSQPVSDFVARNVDSRLGFTTGITFFADLNGSFRNIVVEDTTDTKSAVFSGDTAGIVFGFGRGAGIQDLKVERVHVSWSGSIGENDLPVDSFGIDLNKVKDAELIHVEVDHCGSSGINIQNGSRMIAVRNSKVHDNGISARGDRNGIGIGGQGDSSSDILIERVDLYRNWNHNIEIASTDKDLPMRDIRISHSFLRDGKHSGIQVGGGHTGIVLECNKISGNADKDMLIYEGTSGKPQIRIVNDHCDPTELE